MKSKIQSLLGIEIALGKREFKPFLLVLGILLFSLLSVPILLSLAYYKIKNTLYNQYKEIKKEHKLYYKRK